MSKLLWIKNYGCQMNTSDSDRITEILEKEGYKLTSDIELASIIVLNTCYIREKAFKKLLSDLGRLRLLKNNSLNPIIIVAGCAAKAEGDSIIKRAPWVDIVIGPKLINTLPELLNKKLANNNLVTQFNLNDLLIKEIKSPSSYLVIQEGCNRYCSYCVVPFTRGPEHSRPVTDILIEAKKLIEKGVKELVLLGQNVNAYHGEGPDNKEWSLAKLLFKLAEFNEIKRLRYITSHPKDMTDDLINAHKNLNILMPYIHLPAQSGSNKILNLMNRGYSKENYLKVIEKLEKAKSDITFSSDFIIGFPSEEDNDFNETVKLIEEVNYSQAYSFNYSERPGTKSFKVFSGKKIPVKTQKERLKYLQDIINNKQLSYNKSFIGKELEVMFEKTGRKENQLIGRSPYFQSVYVNDADESLIGKFVNVFIEDFSQHSLKGRLIA